MVVELRRNSAKRVWAFILAIVFVMAMLTASLLMLMLDASVIVILGIGFLIVATCTFLIMSGYHVVLPSVEVIKAASRKDELDEMAAALFIPIVDDEAELKARLVSFIEANAGKEKTWVAPPRLLSITGFIFRQASASSEVTARDKSPVAKPRAKLVRRLRKQ